MISRLSNVKTIYVNSVGISSVFTIGDSVNITPVVKVLAVQREEEKFFGNEGDLTQFPIFHKEIIQPVVYEQISTVFFHQTPKITVDHISVTGISSSSVFQIGSSKAINCESRTKHIRHLKDLT